MVITEEVETCQCTINDTHPPIHLFPIQQKEESNLNNATL